MNLELPKAPEYSYLADFFLQAYLQISRARRYEQGIPLPLSLRDVADFADHENLPVSRRLFHQVVFAIDDVALESVSR